MSSLSNYVEGEIMNALFNNVSPAALQLANRYVQLHTGDPGKDGVDNVAGNSLRKLLMGAGAVLGVFTSQTDLVWTNVPSVETYTDISVWDSLSGGNCLWVGELTVAQPVNVGDTFTIPSGLFTATLI